MARKRTIDPDSWTDAKLADLSEGAHLLWIGTVSFADDEGRIEWDARQLKFRIMPGKVNVSVEMVAGWMGEIVRHGAIETYIVKGKEYAYHEAWRKHQYVNKPAASKIPPPEANDGQLSLTSPDFSQSFLGKSMPSESESESVSGSSEPKGSAPPKIFERPAMPCNLPDELPADMQRFTQVANVFLGTFGNCWDEIAQRRHRSAYMTALATFRSRGISTVQTWSAFTDARIGNNGTPLFGAQAKTALAYLPARSSAGGYRQQESPYDVGLAPDRSLLL